MIVRNPARWLRRKRQFTVLFAATFLWHMSALEDQPPHWALIGFYSMTLWALAFNVAEGITQ